MVNKGMTVINVLKFASFSYLTYCVQACFVAENNIYITLIDTVMKELQQEQKGAALN